MLKVILACVISMENQISVQFFCTKLNFKIRKKRNKLFCIGLHYLLVSQMNEAFLQQMLLRSILWKWDSSWLIGAAAGLKHFPQRFNLSLHTTARWDWSPEQTAAVLLSRTEDAKPAVCPEWLRRPAVNTQHHIQYVSAKSIGHNLKSIRGSLIRNNLWPSHLLTLVSD